MIKKVNKFLSKYWEIIIMFAAGISAIIHMMLGYEFRGFVFMFLLVGLGTQKTIAELVTWVRVLCGLLYNIEKEKGE